MMFTHVLLLNLCLLSSAYANEESSQDAVSWLHVDRSVLAHVTTPDLFYWNQRDQFASHYPGAFIFNFTLTPDGRTLLVNGEAILPRTNPEVPTLLRAHQIPWNATYYYRSIIGLYGTSLKGRPVMDLDYYIDAPNALDTTSIYNRRYDPRIEIDLLRATVHNDSGPDYTVDLSSPSQNQIWIHLEDLSEHPPGTPYSDIPLKIGNVKVNRRWAHMVNYKPIDGLPGCYIWSWRCSDTDYKAYPYEYPYYEYVYQENFDQFGKKGSLRHFLTTRWANLVGLRGFWYAVMLLAVCGSMVLSPFVYAVSRGVKFVLHLYRSRIKEVDDWNEDEEVEGILMYDQYLEAYKDVLKEDITAKKEEEKGSIDASLPAHIDSPVETEKSVSL